MMRKEDILAKCIDDIREGRTTVAECLAHYPELSNELRSLLAVAGVVQAQSSPAPSPQFKQRARQRLLELMEQTPACRKSLAYGVSSWLETLWFRRVMGISLLVTLFIFAAGMLLGGTAYAVQTSLPGDVFYPVKTGAEKLQLAVTREPEAKANLNLALAQRRIDEVIAQSNLESSVSSNAPVEAAMRIDEAIREAERESPPAQRDFITRLAEATLSQQLELSRVMATAPEHAQPGLEKVFVATRRGNIVAQVAFANPDFLRSHPSVSDSNLETGRFSIEGVMADGDDEEWNVGGLRIKNVSSAKVRPAAGSLVTVEGLVKDSKSYIVRVESRAANSDRLEISGRFQGTSGDGGVWYVSGIAVNAPESKVLPSQGDNIHLHGSGQEGFLSVTSLDNEEFTQNGVRISGLLTGVGSSSTINMRVLASRLSINIDGAQIRDKDGDLLESSALAGLVGSRVQVDGAYQKGGQLYAKKVYVDDESEEGDDEEGGRNNDEGNESEVKVASVSYPVDSTSHESEDVDEKDNDEDSDTATSVDNQSSEEDDEEHEEEDDEEHNDSERDERD